MGSDELNEREVEVKRMLLRTPARRAGDEIVEMRRAFRQGVELTADLARVAAMIFAASVCMAISLVSVPFLTTDMTTATIANAIGTFTAITICTVRLADSVARFSFGTGLNRPIAIYLDQACMASVAAERIMWVVISDHPKASLIARIVIAASRMVFSFACGSGRDMRIRSAFVSLVCATAIFAVFGYTLEASFVTEILFAVHRLSESIHGSKEMATISGAGAAALATAGFLELVYHCKVAQIRTACVIARAFGDCAITMPALWDPRRSSWSALV
jgi:hypothetical protein